MAVNDQTSSGLRVRIQPSVEETDKVLQKLSQLEIGGAMDFSQLINSGILAILKFFNFV